jgi:VanZ family protein
MGATIQPMISRPSKKKLLAWMPALICMAAIFLASATPANRIENFGAWDTLIKKGGHFTGYAILGITYLIGIGERRRHGWMLAISLAVLFAASDELHQLYTPGRHSSWMDVGIDSMGAAAGVWLWIKLRASERIRRLQPSSNSR